MPEPIVIAGWGQITQPRNAKPPFLDPLDMMEHAARDAAVVAGAGSLASVDALLVVRTQSRVLDAPERELARRLGIKPRLARVSGIGGEVPQHYVNQAAGLLARREAETVLICGAETYYPRSADAVRGEAALIQGVPEDYDADDAVGSDALEQRHGLTLPIHGFPLFETALWARSGLDRDTWRERVGALWARFSAVAAEHPNAWSREALSAERIITPAPDNRPICFPYTKRMVSQVMADLGAAVIVTTAARAARFQGGARPAYFLGGGFAKDRQRFLADKSDYTYSPSLAAAADKAQARAGLRVEDIDGFDLYSCFPCAVNVARGQLGLGDEDPRPLTQTGGLGFFGGPGSNYALHGIASLAEAISAGRLRTGMATALGWFMHKYAVGIYADRPGAGQPGAGDREDDAAPEAGDRPVPRVDAATGEGTLDTYTVVYARDHSPVRGILYGRTDAGLRFVANAPEDPSEFAALTEACRVGARVRLTHEAASGVNRATLSESAP